MYNSKARTEIAERTEASVIKVRPSRVLKSNGSAGRQVSEEPVDSGWEAMSRMAYGDL